MCKFASSVITKNGDIYYDVKNDSHEDLIEKHLKNEKEENYARVEIVPPNNDKTVRPLSKWRFILDEKRKPDWWSEWHKLECYKTLKKRMTFTGKYKGYYKDGTVSYEHYYKDGERNGKYKGYYKDGTVSYEHNYKDGERNGKYISYYRDGTVSYEHNYKDGKLVMSTK